MEVIMTEFNLVYVCDVWPMQYRQGIIPTIRVYDRY